MILSGAEWFQAISDCFMIYTIYMIYFGTIFVPFRSIQFQVIFLIFDSFLVLFPLHIRRKCQEYVSYVNTDKRNIIHTSIQTQRIKLKEGGSGSLEVPKFAKEKFKLKNEICQTKVQKTRCCLKLATITFDMPMISATI